MDAAARVEHSTPRPGLGTTALNETMGEEPARQPDMGMCPQEQPQQSGTVTDRLISVAYQVHYGQGSGDVSKSLDGKGFGGAMSRANIPPLLPVGNG